MRAVGCGDKVEVFQPGFGTVPLNGTVDIEGPHYPKPHTWYAQVIVDDGQIIEVLE